MQSSDYCMLARMAANPKVIAYFITIGFVCLDYFGPAGQKRRMRLSFLKISECFFKNTGNILGLYFSFFCTTQPPGRKHEKNPVTLLSTDIKQITNNQSKAITSNPEAENNSVGQLR